MNGVMGLPAGSVKSLECRPDAVKRLDSDLRLVTREQFLGKHSAASLSSPNQKSQLTKYLRLEQST